MTSPQNILSGFNDHFNEFLNDILSVFPDNIDIIAAKNSLILIRKTNPKIIIQIWDSYVVGKYTKEIELGNIDFFISKDYSSDLNNLDDSKKTKITESIDRLRNPIKLMNDNDRDKSMKYIQNLTKLSKMYFTINK
jgi:hypothetical protein